MYENSIIQFNDEYNPIEKAPFTDGAWKVALMFVFPSLFRYYHVSQSSSTSECPQKESNKYVKLRIWLISMREGRKVKMNE